MLTVAGGVLMRVELDCLHLKNVKIDEPCESQLLRAIFGEAHDHPERCAPGAEHATTGRPKTSGDMMF